MVARVEITAAPTMPLREFMALFMVDEDLSITFVRQGVRVPARVRLALDPLGETADITITVETLD